MTAGTKAYVSHDGSTVDGDAELGAYGLVSASYTFDRIGIINLEALLSLRDKDDNDAMDMGENVLKTGVRGP